MGKGFVILRREEDGRLSHLTFMESDILLSNEILERFIVREIPAKTNATAEDVFKLLNGEQDAGAFLKEHKIDGFGSEARRTPKHSFVVTAKATTIPCTFEKEEENKMSWYNRFITLTDEQHEEIDELIGTVTEVHKKDLATWSTENIYWGLQGGAEDLVNAREMIINAEDEQQAEEAGKEYAHCLKTLKRYKKEAKRRLKLYEKWKRKGKKG